VADYLVIKGTKLITRSDGKLVITSTVAPPDLLISDDGDTLVGDNGETIIP